MAGKEAFLEGFMEKWAAGGLLYKNLIQRPRVAVKQMVRNYNKTNNRLMFKAQKYLARGAIGLGAVGYGVHQITKAPKPEEMASTYQPPQV